MSPVTTLLLFGILYIGSSAAIGATCGLLVWYGRKSERKGPPYYKAWTAYALGMILVFSLILLIRELEQMRLWGEPFRWIALAVLVACFLAPVLVAHKKGELKRTAR